MTKGTNLMEHLNKFKRQLTELEVIGVKIEEKDKAVWYICHHHMNILKPL